MMAPLRTITKLAEDIEISISDKKLFKQISELIDPDIQYYLRDADLGGSFPQSMTVDLERMIQRAKDPNNEFINYELEKLRADLYDRIVLCIINASACIKTSTLWTLGKIQ